MPGHEEFLELCAVSVTGELTEDEQTKLEAHLKTCPSCREAFEQYQKTAATVIPELASEMPLPRDAGDLAWSEEKAEAALLRRIRAEEQSSQGEALPNPAGNLNRATGYVPPPPRWGQFGMLYAAGILLFVSLAVCAYRVGEKRGIETAGISGRAKSGDLESSKKELSDAGHDRELLLAQIESRDRSIAELKQQLAKHANVADSGGPHPQGQELPNSGASKASSLSNNSQSVREAAELRNRLDLEVKQRAEEVARASSLETKVTELTKQLQDKDAEVASHAAAARERDDLLKQRETTITRQDELLAHDRDIRDLMSARDLYIAEVYDVAKTGETNKPYGRIFYTRGKSLLFYAYDLDQQAGLKKASTFQAWGRREGRQDQPVNLGVLYEDSAANKRWVVRSEDQKTLEQIDAVFVTVEPNGGSRHPSGKPLLFASLRIHPNHP
jgi:hypothetical protein